MNKLLISLLAFTSLAIIPIQADKPALNTTVTLGYDSRYVLYGYRLSRHLYHADVYLYYPLDDRYSIWSGGWYGYLTDGTYHEVDVYAGLDYAWKESLSVGLAYSLFNYIEVPYPTSDQSHEIAAHVTYTADPFSLSLRNQYDSEADGYLLRAIGELTQPLTEKFSIVLNAEAGYSLRYFVPGNQWNHAQVMISLPYQLNESVNLTAFIARSIPLSAIDDFEYYETYGGISVSMSF